MRPDEPIEVPGMTVEEKLDLVLDAYSKGAVTRTELEWLLPLVLTDISLARRRLLELIVGSENYELIENIE